jgi:hypothetical protein
MIEIMEELHQYVPTTTSSTSAIINNEVVTIPIEKLHCICLGGDQLSAARYRGSGTIRSNSTSATKRLEGLVPVSEDWHTQVTLLKVINVLFSELSVVLIYII